MASQPVRKLVVRVIVDNTVEWFSPPPGNPGEFLLEVPQQLMSHPPIHKETGVPILDLPNYCCGAHGLSLLLTTTSATGEESTLLFDAGPEPHTINRNVAALKVTMGTIDRIVLSHWHSDHSGGILQALRLISKGREGNQQQEPIPVDVHSDRHNGRGIAPPPTYKVIARLPDDPKFDEITAAGGIVEPHREGHTVSNGAVYVSGEIPRLTEWETGLIGGVQWVDGKWVREPGQLVMDERYVCIDVKDKGLCIFSSCSHAGIVNVVKDTKKQFPGRPVHLVLGGFHLGGRELEYRIEPTVAAFVNDLNAKYIVPLHCTGHKAKVAFTNALASSYVAGGVGLKVTVDSSV